jgi:hypothetical protein
MEESQARVEAYLRDKVVSTNWMFISLIGLNNAMGFNAKAELNDLHRQGYVASRQGVNGILVEVTAEGFDYLTKVSIKGLNDYK